MLVYDYRCVDCGEGDERVADVEVHIALCSGCGGLMLRLDEEIFTPYFEIFETI